MWSPCLFFAPCARSSECFFLVALQMRKLERPTKILIIYWKLRILLKIRARLFICGSKCRVSRHSYLTWRTQLLLPRSLSPYCAFHKHANSNVQKPPSQLRFSLPSIIITITRNEPWNTETHKKDRNPPITNHKPWPFEPDKEIR